MTGRREGCPVQCTSFLNKIRGGCWVLRVCHCIGNVKHADKEIMDIGREFGKNDQAGLILDVIVFTAYSLRSWPFHDT